MSTGEISKTLGINKSRLHYYQQKGLIVPEFMVGGMAIYKKDETIKILKKIIEKRDKGISINQIKQHGSQKRTNQ
jgi:DNA-binding transcriptional MerR regulator